MKELLVAFLITLLSFVPTAEGCYAKDMPVAVIGEDVWLLGEGGERLFLLPETYYAPIVGIDDTYYTVSFNGIVGKIPKMSVSVTGYGDEVAGTQQLLRVSGKYSAFTGLKIRLSPEENSVETDASIPVSESFTYLGSYPYGDEVWYYVVYGDRYGYVLSDYCDKKVETALFKTEENVEKEEDSAPKDDSLLKILIISGVAVTVVILLIVLLIPKKGKTRYYYET